MTQNDPPDRLTLDGAYVSAFLWDKDFSDLRRVYLNRRTGELVEVFEDDYGAEFVSADENRENRQRIEENPSECLEVPIPDHAQYHTWFQDFLDGIDETGYFGSIGGWLSEYGSAEVKADWQDFSRQQVALYFVDFCTRNNTNVIVGPSTPTGTHP